MTLELRKGNRQQGSDQGPSTQVERPDMGWQIAPPPPTPTKKTSLSLPWTNVSDVQQGPRTNQCVTTVCSASRHTPPSSPTRHAAAALSPPPSPRHHAAHASRPLAGTSRIGQPHLHVHQTSSCAPVEERRWPRPSSPPVVRVCATLCGHSRFCDPHCGTTSPLARSHPRDFVVKIAP